MPDPTFDELLSAYLDGETSPAESELVERLLESTDPVIAQETKRRLDALARVSDALRSLPVERAPVELAPSIRLRTEREQLLASLPPTSAAASEPSVAASPASASVKPTDAGPRRWKTWVAVVGSLAATACAVALAIRPFAWNRWQGEPGPHATMARAERSEALHGWHDSDSGYMFETASRNPAPIDESTAAATASSPVLSDPSGENSKAMEDRELSFSKKMANPVSRDRETAGSRPGNFELADTFRKPSAESAKVVSERLAGAPNARRAPFGKQLMEGGGMGSGAGAPGLPGRVAAGKAMPRPAAAAMEAGSVEAPASSVAPSGLMANNAPGGFIVPPRVGIGQIVPYFSNVEGKIAVIEMQVLDFEEAVGGFRVLLQENGVPSVDTSVAMGDADVNDVPASDFVDLPEGERRKANVPLAPADRRSPANTKGNENDRPAAATAPSPPRSEVAGGVTTRKSQNDAPATGPAAAADSLRQKTSNALPVAGGTQPQAPETYVLYVDAPPEQIIAAYEQLLSVGNGGILNGIFRNPVAFEESADEGALRDRDAALDAPAPNAARPDTRRNVAAKDDNPTGSPATKGIRSDAKNESVANSRARPSVTDEKPADKRLAEGQSDSDGLPPLATREAADESNFALSPSQEQQVVSRLNRFYRVRSLRENEAESGKAEPEPVEGFGRLMEGTSGKSRSTNGQEAARKSDSVSKPDTSEKRQPAPAAVSAPPPAPSLKTPQPALGGTNGKPSPKASPESVEAKKESQRVPSDNPRGTVKSAEDKSPAQLFPSPFPALTQQSERKPRSGHGEDSVRAQGREGFSAGPAFAEIPGEPLPGGRAFQYGFRVPLDQSIVGNNLNPPSKEAGVSSAKPEESANRATTSEFGRKGDNARDERAFNLPRGGYAGDRNVNRYGNSGLRSSSGPEAEGAPNADEARGQRTSARGLGRTATPPSDKASGPADAAPSVKVLFIFQRVPAPPATTTEPAAAPTKPPADRK